MASQRQLDLLIKLHELEKTLESSKGKARREAELQYEEICSKIDARVLKYYERREMPFGEFRDRTCMGCGMVYPETHIHCRPKADVIRLCESCGRILMDAAETGDADNDSPDEAAPIKTGGSAGKTEAKAKAKAEAKSKAKIKSNPAPAVETAKIKRPRPERKRSR